MSRYQRPLGVVHYFGKNEPGNKITPVKKTHNNNDNNDKLFTYLFTTTARYSHSINSPYKLSFGIKRLIFSFSVFDSARVHVG